MVPVTLMMNQEVTMREFQLRVARAIARSDDPRILDGSEDGLRLWEARESHYLMLAYAALDAVIANGLGEPEDLRQHAPRRC